MLDAGSAKQDGTCYSYRGRHDTRALEELGRNITQTDEFLGTPFPIQIERVV
jgi:hypothetical protein